MSSGCQRVKPSQVRGIGDDEVVREVIQQGVERLHGSIDPDAIIGRDLPFSLRAPAKKSRASMSPIRLLAIKGLFNDFKAQGVTTDLLPGGAQRLRASRPILVLGNEAWVRPRKRGGSSVSDAERKVVLITGVHGVCQETGMRYYRVR